MLSKGLHILNKNIKESFQWEQRENSFRGHALADLNTELDQIRKDLTIILSSYTEMS